jgi:hypothetical protein
MEVQAKQDIAERISAISVSSTMRVSADAEKLRTEGVDVVDFGAGEPDFPTPDNIKRAAIRGIEQNFTKYTNAGGTLELKQAVCDRHAEDFDTHYQPQECIITVGGKHAIFNLTQALINPGDEVVIPAPYWVTYKDVVNYAGGKCVFVDADEERGFTITAAMIAPYLTPRTKLVIINSPSNPSGAVLDPEDFEKIYQLAIFNRLAAGREGDRAGGRLALQNLCHDRMAHRLRTGAGAHYRSHVETAESFDFQSDFDIAKGRRGGAARAAGIGGNHAGRVSQAPRLRRRAPAGHSRRDLCRAERRVLRLS